jgi:hypothetical protein
MKSPYLLYSLIVTSFISALLLVTPHGFPYLGLSFAFICGGMWAYGGTRSPNIWTKLITLSIIFLSLMLVVWANPVLTFLNIASILTLGALLIVNPQLTLHHPMQMLANYGLVWLHLWQKKPAFDWQQSLESTTVKSVRSPNTFLRLLASIVLTIVISLILVRVFSSANPIFSFISTWIADTLSTLELRQDVGFWIWRLVLFVIFGIFFNRLRGNSQKSFKPTHFIHDDFPLLLPKIATSLLCALFIFTHGLMLINPQAVLSKIGVTHSQTTREIFGQMALASFVSLALITLRRDKNKVSNGLSLVLLLGVILLTTIGLQSDYQYIAQFGLTHKRLYGLASVLWLYALIGLVFYWIKRGGAFVITRGVVAITIGMLVLINLINFDGLIATYSPRITQQGTDYSYLAYNLSADAGTLWQQYQEAKQQYVNSTSNDNLLPLSAMLYRLPPGISANYEFNYDGSFNFSKYILYRNSKKLPVKEEIKWLHSQEQKYHPVPEPFKSEDFIPASRSAQIKLTPKP